jgi:hypothetical protein
VYKDLPTLEEAGLKGFEREHLARPVRAQGHAGRRGQKTLNDALKAALKDPDFIKKQEGLGAVVVTSDGRVDGRPSTRSSSPPRSPSGRPSSGPPASTPTDAAARGMNPGRPGARCSGAVCLLSPGRERVPWPQGAES